MLDNINVRKFKDEDKSKVIDLLNRNFNTQEHLKVDRDHEWWEWKYNDNLFGKPIIFVAELSDKIIGVRPFWPWKLNFEGNEIRCFQPIDAVVDKEYRGQGIFSLLSKKALQDSEIMNSLIFNFPNEQSIGSNIKLGWKFVGKLKWYVKVNKFVAFSKLAVNYSGFKSLSLEKEDLISQNKIKEISFRQNIEKFKTLKTNEFLIWRYLGHPKINYGLNVINSKEKQIYFIFEINENEYGRELIILDYDGDLKLYPEMLQKIDRISKKYNVAYTLIIKKNEIPFILLLGKRYFLQKKKNLVVLPINKAYSNEAVHYDNWEICLGMHDSI